MLAADARARAPAAASPRADLEAELLMLEREGFGADAAWIRVQAALTDDRSADVDALLEAAMGAAATDPWIVERVLYGVLRALPEAGPSERRIAALQGHLAGASFEEPRRNALLALEQKASSLTPRRGCAATLALFEPHPPTGG